MLDFYNSYAQLWVAGIDYQGGRCSGACYDRKEAYGRAAGPQLASGRGGGAASAPLAKQAQELPPHTCSPAAKHTQIQQQPRHHARAAVLRRSSAACGSGATARKRFAATISAQHSIRSSVVRRNHALCRWRR
jgi:hypothetical protein